MMSTSSSTIKWNKALHNPGSYTRRNPIVIGDSLWYSSITGDKDEEDREAMIEYSLSSQKVTQTIHYPSYIVPGSCYCCLVENTIYIIDGPSGSITAFDPKLTTFTKKASFPRIGGYPSAILVKDAIRIFNGNKNIQHDIVFNTRDNSVKILKTEHNKAEFVTLVLFQGKIISIGGWDDVLMTRLDTVQISAALNDNDAIQWTTNPQWKLPVGLDQAGCVLYRHYILVFGGSSGLYQDVIYLLDLSNEDNTWEILKHITCPVPGYYVATLTPDSNVHLFLGENRDGIRGHYTLPLSTVMGDWYPFQFDLKALKYVDTHTRNIVYGYFRDKYDGILENMPNDIIDICLLYFFA